MRFALRAPADALTIALEFQPDLVLLDLGLPVMSGYEVAQALRANPRTAGAMVVAVTGYGMPAERLLAEDAGVDLHLVKPVPFEQLHAAVTACSRSVPHPRQDRTVLVVDDNPAGRYALTRGLSASGFKVLGAASGMDGFERAREADAVVLDVSLPDMDGREVCRRLRAQASTAATPVSCFSYSRQ